MKKYNPSIIEKKWQKYWEKNKTFQTKESDGRPKFYVLDMFPYPSGAGLHVGHPKGYIATDIVARMKMMQGHNVLHPMGWDAFGLPAENYALKNKLHPAESTAKNVNVFKKQLGLLGFTYDWDREVNTTDPAYYRWTQWMFLEMYKRGLVFESYEPINWCPDCKTGLANEDLDDGKCERCGSEVEQKPMRQWVIKITDYAERLLNDIEKLTAWPEPIKEMQRNWIGKSEGALVRFAVSPSFQEGVGGVAVELEVFTTRPDTLFGCTYCVVAPEHKLLENQKSNIKNQKEVSDYVAAAKNKTVMERTELAKEKTGIEIKGIKAVNPVNGEEVPVFVADYVLGSYGTGAIMAVPAHDERDWEFAKKYNLPIKEVLKGGNINEAAFTEDGELVNSQFLDGLHMADAKKKMIAWLEEKKLGQKKVQYKLRDWVFSRQRYWGEPIPLIKCEACAHKKYNYIVIHGWKSDSTRGFKPWLKSELIKLGHQVWVPDLPHTSEPKVDEQANYVIKNCPFEINSDTILVGHSLGGPVIYKILEKISAPLRRVVLVDPVVTAKFSDHERPAVSNSSDWNFDWKKVQDNARDIIILGDQRFQVIRKDDLEKLRDLLRCNLRVVMAENKHFSSSNGEASMEPEILDACVVDGWVPVPEDELPVELPKVKQYEPSGTGESPLATIDKWVNTKCPVCGGPAKRETNTMPQWAGSSWYYLAYTLPKSSKLKANSYNWDKEKINYWNPVDFYVGGAEHATRHLIYARFWHKFLFDIGMVGCEEPFTRLQNLGVILAEDGRKMSKRWNNVINPDDVVAKFGADAMRLYEMFMGPFDQPCAWSTQGVVGMRRFLEKVWALREHIVIASEAKQSQRNPENEGIASLSSTPRNDKLDNLLHKTIKKVTEDIGEMRFNTAIAQMMTLVNEMSKEVELQVTSYKLLLQILSPFAPHICEELWEMLSGQSSITTEPWPKYDPALTQDSEFTLAVQVNGKLRDTIVVPTNISEVDVKQQALASEKVQKWLEGKEPKKVIYVKGRLISIVV